MRVVVLGIRGIPNVEGGIETHAEHLYPRLAAMGCEVDVLVRSPFVPPQQRSFGPIRLRRIWSPTTAGLEALGHSILGVLYAGFARPDVLHIHAVGPALATPIARLLGLKVVVTHHGPDYDRDKWGALARWVLRLGERLGMRYANARIAISQVIVDLIRTKYGRDAILIPNGVLPAEPSADSDHVRGFGLEPGRYFLHVGRMVPEKRQLDLVKAYQAVLPSAWKLVLVGRLTDETYPRIVRMAAQSEGVVLTGFLTGMPLHQVYSHAGAFVLPSSHEGLPIAMLEALSYGLPVLASDIPANRAVGLESDSYFPLGDLHTLARKMTDLTSMPYDAEARRTRQRWVAERFDWDAVAEQTLAVYKLLTRSP